MKRGRSLARAHLIIDINLSHLWLHLLLHLALELLILLLLQYRRADLLDAGRSDELGQLEGDLLDAALSHEELALLRPVLWDGDRVAVRFEVDE